MNLLGFGDVERWLIIVFLSISTYLLWSSHWYDKPLKTLLTIPRTYLFFYYLLIIFDMYKVNPTIQQLAMSGIGSLYGMCLLLFVEVYVRWVTRKYIRIK